MSIFPLDQFEQDLKADEQTRLEYEKLQAPKTIVVRFGSMRLIGEFPYQSTVTPGCGSKIVVRTHRGLEIGEMLTSTCANAGCGKSVTRQEMLEYIERSGGKDYPFYTDGRAIRVATLEDLNKQSQLDGVTHDQVRQANKRVEEFELDMRIIEAEPILGEERLTFYFTAEHRVDFRELVRTLAEDNHTRIELRQVGSRDEARLTADYERCGQHCCCRQFLKVLKPVSMRSAKVQKATLDPLKISGRCGRLMCCLRYEDETYEDLRKRLPHRKTRVGTVEGPGIVVDSQILTQLVRVELDADRRRIAVPVEELCDPDAPIPVQKAEPDPLRGLNERQAEERADSTSKKKRKRRRGRGKGRPSPGQPDASSEDSGEKTAPAPNASSGQDGESQPAGKKKRRRRGKRRRNKGGGQGGSGGSDSPAGGAPES
jgi:cell fate regulator YaaT (PSP1 superfamily)